MKPIRMENGVIIYYGSRAGRVDGGLAVVDPMFEGPELNNFLEKQKNIREVKWQDGTFDRLVSGPKDTREVQALKNCRMWQLKPDVDIHMKFIGYDDLCRSFGPPDPENYQCVFDGAVDTDNPEALCTEFDMDKPTGYHGHSPAISDVVELYDDLVSTFYYIDRYEFKQVEFEPPGQQMALRMQF